MSASDAPAVVLPVAAVPAEEGEVQEVEEDENDLLASPTQDHTITKWQRQDDQSDEENDSRD